MICLTLVFFFLVGFVNIFGNLLTTEENAFYEKAEISKLSPNKSLAHEKPLNHARVGQGVMTSLIMTPMMSHETIAL